MDDKTEKTEAGPRGTIVTPNVWGGTPGNLTTADLARAPENRVAEPGEGAEQARSGNGAQESPPLLSAEQSGGLKSAWDGIQASFVDEPRKAVADADHLVADAIRRLAESFAAERARLEQQWDRGEDVSTEDLRLALQRYRSFFHRLLSV